MLQVCSYRCIVSHESQLLEDFSLCILQKHNCLGKSAEIPALPDPPPMTAFRGEELTHELAEGLFIGWLGIPNSATATTIQETAGTGWKCVLSSRSHLSWDDGESQVHGSMLVDTGAAHGHALLTCACPCVAEGIRL